MNLYGPINTLGYGLTCFNVLKELVQQGIDVSYFPIGEFANNDIIHRTRYDIKKFDRSAPCVKIWHQFDMALRVGKGVFFGWPIFELDSFNEKEISHLSSCDSIIVCSRWAKTIIDSTISDIKCDIVPLGVDTSIFYPRQQKTDKCIFLNCGKWEIRKGHDILGECFKDTFQKTNDVELWMMADNPFLTKDEQDEWERFYAGNDSRIKLIHRVNTHEEVSNIMSATTAGVFPSRAEGWNLELLEMMAMGKSVIATDYSGHTEYCNQENCYLIKIKDKEDAYDGKWFHGQGRWASLGEQEVKKLSMYMKLIYFKWKGNEDLLNKNGLETANTFTWSNSVKKLIEVVK